MLMTKKEGFTIIEILISIVILGLIVTVLFNINIAGFKFLSYNQDVVELQNQARIINNSLERQIRKANKIEINSNNEIVLSDGDVKIYVDETVDPMRLQLENSSGIKNITDKIIEEYTFTMEDADSGLIYFYFKLKKDKSTYEIQNKFYPRAKN